MPKRDFARIAAPLAVSFVAWGSSSCASGLHGAALVDSVRVLATQVTVPDATLKSGSSTYATPGATVTLNTLAYDGRADQPAPMSIYWIPIVCEDPADDAYYNCFQQFAGLVPGNAGTDAGASTGAGSGASGVPALPVGVPIPGLQVGPSFTFTMPSGIVTAHPVTPNTTPYGLAIVFNVACAGHVEFVPIDPNNVQSPPIGCFDAQHNQLGPDDYVIGFTRVYAYDASLNITNQNPVIDHVDFDGSAVAFAPDPQDPSRQTTQPITMSACGAGSTCPTHHIGPVVLPDNQEVNPIAHSANGSPVREQIWAAFFATFGSLSDENRLLYDPATGSIGGPSVTDDGFQAPSTPGDGTLWIVVHDDRGGVSWATVPVHVI